MNKRKLREVLESKSTSRARIDFLLSHSIKYKMIFNANVLIKLINEEEYKTYYTEIQRFIHLPAKKELCKYYLEKFEVIKAQQLN